MYWLLVTTSRLLKSYRYAGVVCVVLLRRFLNTYIQSKICEMVLQKMFMAPDSSFITPSA